MVLVDGDEPESKVEADCERKEYQFAKVICLLGLLKDVHIFGNFIMGSGRNLTRSFFNDLDRLQRRVTRGSVWE
jgi:hypothetical protein